MDKKKFIRWEFGLLMLPILGLAAFGFGVSSEEEPPKLKAVTTRPLTPQEREFSLDPKLDTRIVVQVRYPPSLRFRWLGGETPSLDLTEIAFYDQNNQNVLVRQAENFLEAETDEEDLYAISYDIALSDLPPAVKQLRARMQLNMASKWTLPASALIYKR